MKMKRKGVNTEGVSMSENVWVNLCVEVVHVASPVSFGCVMCGDSHLMGHKY